MYSELEYVAKVNGPCDPKRYPNPFDRPCTPLPHIHDEQTETFTLISGSMSYYHEDLTTPKHAKIGEKIVVKPLTPHTVWNDSPDQDMVVTIRLEPAPESSNEQFFETVSGVNRDLACSGLDGCGEPPLLQMIVLLNGGGVMPGDAPLPLWLVRIIWKSVAAFGRLMGYREYYDEYSKPW